MIANNACKLHMQKKINYTHPTPGERIPTYILV